MAPPEPNLSHLRFPLSGSRGRRFPEPAHPYRNPFERDRGRIIHSRAFRRLEGKTQVFAPRRGDHFRNRLTHTLEVAQIGRTVARRLGLDHELVETLALVHDIGHPPFGHAGEEELDRQMQRFGERFEHNLQALRLVDFLERRYILFPGLNLTFEVREGIAKHSRELTPQDDADFPGLLPQLRPPLEAQLIDLADEIAYNTADLDDAFQAGLITLDDVASATPLLAETLATLQSRYPAAEDELLLQEAIRQLVDALATGLIDGTLAAAHASGVASSQGLRELDHRLATYSTGAATATADLKRFLRAKVYQSADVQTGRAQSITRMAQLFEALSEDPSLVPASHRTSDDDRPHHRLICDYIAGMTDAYFLRAYQDIFGLN